MKERKVGETEQEWLARLRADHNMSALEAHSVILGCRRRERIEAIRSNINKAKSIAEVRNILHHIVAEL